MKIAIDIDTITAAPEFFGEMANGMGFVHDLVILVGTIGPREDRENPEERRKQLVSVGFSQNVHIVEIVRPTVLELAMAQAEFCLTNDIDILFGDNQLVVTRVSEGHTRRRKSLEDCLLASRGRQ